jgi:hypothetical protein
MHNNLLPNDQYLSTKYDISKYGFLTDPDTIPDTLPTGFEEYVEIVNNIENDDGHYFRQLVNGLKKGKPQNEYIRKVHNLTTTEKKQIYSLFTFIAQKHVRCMGAVNKDEQITEIPYEIGLVWYECAKEFELPCVTSYGATILYNCKFNSKGELTSRHAISGTSDELHFYKIHMDLEKIGGKLLEQMYFYNSKNMQDLVSLLSETTQTIKKITKIMKGMYDGCNPNVFWSNIRLYLGGYTKDNGLPDGLGVTGTDLRFNYGGGSAAQSTLIQAIDIVLGIPHDSEHGVKFLADQRKYMPKKHQQFLIDLEKKYSKLPIREVVMTINDPSLTSVYNDSVSALKNFRMAHYSIVHKYIVQFIETKKWYVKLCDDMFGQNSKVSKNIRELVKFLNKSLNKNNLHGSNGSGGLPTEQLKDYINDTERNKIITSNQRKSTNVLSDYWWLWLCLFYLIYKLFSN